jgi:hypothetical protein
MERVTQQNHITTLWVLAPENGIPVIHQTAHNGTLRIDPARKTEATATTPTATLQAAPAVEQPAPKPISRLE